MSYRGVSFEGSPRMVFWTDFFEPFILAAARSSFEWVRKTCHERNLNPGDCLVEARDLLRLLTAKTYESMALTDQVLRGAGHPNAVTSVEIAAKVRAMTQQIDQLLVAFSREGPPPPSQPNPKDEVLELKPNVFGLGINLRALWRRLRQTI